MGDVLRSLVALVIALFSFSAFAVPAPGLDWRTISTECCDVHFHEAVRPEGERVARMVDDVANLVFGLLQTSPSDRPQIVVSDATDRLNGFATSLPYNLVHVFAVPPERNDDLSTTEDHVRMVLVHELFHIAHLDTVHGLAQFVNVFFGKVWPPNFILPRWLHEGMAVYAETRFTRGGRLRSGRWQGYLRTAALRGDLWSLDDVSNFSRRPPGGTAAYLYGGAFIAWMSRERGEAWLARFNHDYAGRVIPYAIGRSIKETTDLHLDVAWRAFQQDLEEEARTRAALIDARGGQTKTRRLTRMGGSIDRARFFGGTLYVHNNSPNGTTGLYAIDGLPSAPSRPRPIARTNGTAEFDVLDDGRIVLSQLEWSDDWFPFRDLFVIDPERGDIARLTHGARLRDPVVCRATGRIYAVHISSTRSSLVEVDVETGAITERVRFKPREIAYTPAVSPSGDEVAISLRRAGGGRDIVVVHLETGARRDVTRDDAEDIDPVFTSDDEIMFASDHDGAFNVHSIALASGARARLTDLIGSASTPLLTPDGRAVVFADVHLDGGDVYVAERAPRPYNEGARSPSVFAPETARLPELEPLRPDRAYDPLRTLFPRTWIPSLDVGRAGLSVQGEDAVQTQDWAAEISFDWLRQIPELRLAWRYDDLYTPIGVQTSWRTLENSRTLDGQEESARTHVVRVSGDVTLPLRRFLRSHRFRAGLARDFRFSLTPVEGGPLGPRPRYPTSDDVSTVTLSWSYGETQSFRDTASTNWGLATDVRLRLANQFTLSDVDFSEMTFNLRAFREVPGLTGHSFAIYTSAGWASGPRFARRTFALGGIGQRDFVSDLIRGARVGGQRLRGFDPVAVTGDGFAFTSLEYRLPLLAIEQGASSLPVQLSRINLALYTDLGDAFNDLPQLNELRASVGGELQVQLTLGYYAIFLVRGGVARGLNKGRHRRRLPHPRRPVLTAVDANAGDVVAPAALVGDVDERANARLKLHVAQKRSQL